MSFWIVMRDGGAQSDEQWQA